jgi:hypothetical protein
MSSYENISGQHGLRASYLGNQEPRASEVVMIRSELEKEFNNKVYELKSIYEMRVHTLQESIKNGLKMIQSDELIDTMKQDVASEEFIYSRAKEIIEECIMGDKEAMLEKLTHQYTYLKSEYGKLENENHKVCDFMLIYF